MTDFQTKARELVNILQKHVSLGRAYDPHISDDAEEDIAAALSAAYEQGKRDGAEQEREAKDGAYAERNKLVRLVASLFPSGIKKTAIDGWDEDWHWCVYIDMPSGQASWHFHITELPMFSDLPTYAGDWDGHSTDMKYARIAAAIRKRGEA